jgi:hypothetical protein
MLRFATTTVMIQRTGLLDLSSLRERTSPVTRIPFFTLNVAGRPRYCA